MQKGERPEDDPERRGERIDLGRASSSREHVADQTEVAMDLPVAVTGHEQRERVTDRPHALVAGLALELGPREAKPDRQVHAEGEERERRDQPERAAPWRRDCRADQIAPSERSLAISASL